mgnify:CR=1 FL=1
MSINTLKITSLVMLVTTMAFAQKVVTKDYVVVKESSGGDSSSYNITINSNGESGSAEDLVIMKEFVDSGSGLHNIVINSNKGKAISKDMIILRGSEGADSSLYNITIDSDMDLSDSSGTMLWVKSPAHHKRQAARIVIKKTGFFRKSKIVIDFDPTSLEILKVIDNDKEVKPSKFHKYQDHLEDANDYSDLEALHPKMQEIEMRIEQADISDADKIAGLDSILVVLSELESDRAQIKMDHYVTVKRVVELDKLADTILSIIENSGATPPQKVKEIKMEDGKFFLNGDEIKGETGQKCLDAYSSASGIKTKHGSTITKGSSDDNTTITIQFD